MPSARAFLPVLTLAGSAILAATAPGSDSWHPNDLDNDGASRSVHEATELAPYPCLTPLIVRVHNHDPHLSPSDYDKVQQILSHKLLGDSEYVSPLGHFSLHYDTAGPDSVPTEDIDPLDGVPDFVQRCAEYADRAWVTEVDSMGFTAPELPPDGTYDITFMSLPVYWYGYTTVQGTTTTIVMHHTFTGFGFWPSNDDPDGIVAGRAKVTIAHEFKHATQFATSGWVEGPSWMELDATWVEDIVYPLTNEYVYWVGENTNSQLDAPWISMDVTDSTGYEDCLFQHYLSGTWGSAMIRDYWVRRGQYSAEPPAASYAETMQQYNTDWTKCYAKYLEWCWFTGSRAESGFGFPDAAKLLRMKLYEPAVYAYPYSTTGVVSHLASHPRRFYAGPAQGRPRVIFDGSDQGTGFTMSVITKQTDGTFWISEAHLDAENRCDYVVDEPWSTLSSMAVLVTNGDPWGTDEPYTLDVLDDTVVGVAEPAGQPARPRLEARPNPARGSVSLSFELPRAASAQLRILDVGGRTVRRLSLGPQGAPVGEVQWDTRDASGFPLPAGVYWAELDTGESRLVRRITLLR